MKASVIVLMLLVTVPLSACSFLGDVAHATGDFGHGIGDAFENQGARKQGEKPPNDISGKARRSYDYK